MRGRIAAAALLVALASAGCGGHDLDTATIEKELTVDQAGEQNEDRIEVRCIERSPTRALCKIARHYNATYTDGSGGPNTDHEAVTVMFNTTTGVSSWKGRKP